MMIKLNSKNLEQITFEGFFDDNQPDLLFLKNNKIGEESYSDINKIIYIYLGKKIDCNFIKIYDATRFYLRNIKNSLNVNVNSFKFDDSNDGARAVIEGALFAHHNQYSLKTNQPVRSVDFNFIIDENQNNLFVHSKNLIDSVNICRDLNDEPPNVCTPKNFVSQMLDNLKDCSNLNISVLSRKDCEQLGMGIFLSVGEGAKNESQVLVVEYNGDKSSSEKTAFIGKGITFDSGGYALKSHPGQRNERYDMCGASAVISAMYGISKEKPKKNIVAIAALSENRIGGSTTLNSSIIKSMSGQTVEIQSTDAEGRLVMADCITYAIQKLNATKIVTIATLTGSAIQALGKTMSAVMSSNHNFYQEIKYSAAKSKEAIWRLPLTDQNYERARASEYADLINGSWEKYNTAGLAGAFLDNFTDGLPFVHIDIAGSAYINERSHGTMVKTVIEYANK